MNVKTLMRTVPGAVEPSQPLAAAAARLASVPGAALVVVEHGRLMGVLADADVRAAGCSSVPELARHEWPALLARLTVADAMRRDPTVVDPDATAGEVAHMLAARGDRTAVVVDGRDVVGVVGALDLVRALVERLEAETPAGLARVVVGVDVPANPSGGRGLRPPLDTALSIARRHAAALTIVHVMPWGPARIAGDLLPDVDAEVHRARLDDARQALGRMVPRESARSVRIEIRTGDVASGLVFAAVDLAADLIVMGGRSGLVRAVARRAPCPVLAA